MSAETLLWLGGAYQLVIAAFHLMFWKLFAWRDELPKLTPLNRAVMQVLNLCLTFVFVVFAYVSMAHADELLGTGLGRALLALIAVFWALRAVEQVVFFGLRKPASLGLFVSFVLAAAASAAPLPCP